MACGSRKATGPVSGEERNGVMMQFFEWYLPCDHSLWNRLSSGEADNLAAAGVTALWLPPATKGAFGDQGTGYAVYDLYDLGEFDQKGSIPTKYGTKDEYIRAVQACHAAGIKVYADVVLNHKIGADGSEDIDCVEYSNSNRTLPVSGEENIKAWTVFDFKGRAGKYSDFVWNSGCFDGVDWDERHRKNAIYLIKGHSWQQEVDESENGNYDYLMGADIDFDRPYVVEELTRWGEWYMKTTGVDGVRLDAVKHIKAEFYRNWLPKMRSIIGADAFAVGEYWHKDVRALENYLAEVEGEMSLFDVPLHFNFFAASQDGAGYDLRRIFDGSLTAENPVHSVTFVDNHDTQKGQALESCVGMWFKPHAYAMTLLREAGYPCVFYGDYYGIPHDNQPPMKAVLDILLSVRRDYAYGLQTDYPDNAHGIGWTRAQSGLAVVLSSKYNQAIRMNVGVQRAGKVYADVLGNRTEEIVIDKDGWGSFTAKDGYVSVWLPR